MKLKLNATSGSALQWNNVSACSYKLFSQECVGNDGGEGKEEKRREEGKMVIRKKAWIIRPLHAKTVEWETISNMTKLIKRCTTSQ
jgi:hypothetical protein